MQKNATNKPYDELRVEITQRHGSLSKKLRQIAEFALEHPTDMALGTIAVIASRADVQPSALVRFAKAFGYSGFAEMQRSFQTRVVERSANYRERIRAANDSEASVSDTSELGLLSQFCRANIVGLQELLTETSGQSLRAAVDLLLGAESIYVLGQRRSFPVAAYIAYFLNRSGHRSELLDGNGGMLFESAHMTAKDAMVAISFAPYSSETAAIVQRATQAGTPVVAITDSVLSPISEPAEVTLFAHDAEVLSFRSLTSALTLAQTLVMSIVYRDAKD